MDELENNTFNVALTSDIWSGRAKEDYLSIVVHYVNVEHVLQKRIIGFRLVDTSHTSQAISDSTKNVGQLQTQKPCYRSDTRQCICQ